VDGRILPRFEAIRTLRRPDLRFQLPLVEHPTIDCGLKGATEACCRYAHHPNCASAVVRSILGLRCWVKVGDGPSVEYQLAPYSFEGDLLADFDILIATIGTRRAEIESSVANWVELLDERVVIEAEEATVWCLTRDEIEILTRRWERLAPEPPSLPLAYLPDDVDEAALVLAHEGFVPIGSYDVGELVMPGEVGRDHAHRYLSQVVVDTPDPVDRSTIREALVHVRLVDGTETDMLVTAKYTGHEEEPLSLVFEPTAPLHEGAS